MRYSDVLLEYKTKDERNITFEIIEAEEGDNNRGWQIDKISAFVDGKPAGHLKLGYIPRERFKRYYPSIFNWMHQMQGKSFLPREKKTQHWKTYTIDEKRDLIKSLSGFSRYMSQDEEAALANMSDDDVDQKVAELEKQAIKTYGKQFKEFENYFVDKPYEDYIRVFDVGDSTGNRGSGPRSEEGFKRQGIATALYFKAVDYLQKKGLPLRLSTLRSKEGGQAIGDALVKAGLTTPGKPFKYNSETLTFDYLDPKKVKAYQRKHGIDESLVEERTLEDELKHIENLISKLKHMSGRTPDEAAIYRNKIIELKAKADRIRAVIASDTAQPEAEPVADYMPDFGKDISPRKYTRKGGFEPFPFGRGDTYDTKA